MSTCTWEPPTPKPESSKPKHRLASAADFRAAIKEEDLFEPATEVFLPKSEKWVLLRRPKPLAYTLLAAPLPGIPEAGAEGPSQNQSEMSNEEIAHVAGWLAALWGQVFVHPKLSLRPGPDEIHPDWIPEEDQKFIYRWIRGEVNDSGESLSTFSGSVQG
jgi:hypothetical protein